MHCLDRTETDASARRLATSITHRHLLSVLNTKLLDSKPNSATLRVLDIGCGNGRLLIYLQETLEMYHPQLSIEMYGFDVSDSQVQFSGFFQQAISTLRARRPEVDWNARLKLISSTEVWPYTDGFFDITVSNQVGEHVANHSWFFRQNHRVLRDDGFAVHLFPLKNYVVEGHMYLPFAHYFTQWNSRRLYIKLLSSLGFGRWKRMSETVSVDDFSESFADFLTYYCNYISKDELVRICKQSGFRVGFEFTGEFYRSKLRDIFRRPSKFEYRASAWSLISIHFYKWINGVTLVLDKRDRYVNYIAKHESGNLGASESKCAKD
jgi:SAM-dependent methyltransferase